MDREDHLDGGVQVGAEIDVAGGAVFVLPE